METKIILTILAFLVGLAMSHEVQKRETLVGGLSDEKPANEKVKALLSDPDVKQAVFAKVQAKSNSNAAPTQVEPLTYKSQVVAGANYYIKANVKVGAETQTWWIKIFEQAWRNVKQVTDVQGPKEESEKITFF